MILQNILKPDRDTCEVSEMYWHEEGRKFVFDSYFNIFTIHKWLEYTTIRSFNLILNLTGKAEIELFDQDGSLGKRIYDTGTGVRIRIPLKFRETSKCLWFSYEPLDQFANIISGWYETEEKPGHNVHLAADICTFKREPYLKHNLNILTEQLINNGKSPVCDKLDIFVIDNGRTLKKEEIETDHIHLFPNMNAGGTGGFTRGLIEINKKKDEMGLTHMIFMDDDAVLCPDSLVRTFGILSYVNKKWEKACVSGAMLRIDMQYSQHEYGSKWDGTDCYSRYPGLDLRIRDNVIRNEEMDEADYAPWWYACYPLTETGMDNLPLPLFIHNDDTEYGLRHKKNGFILLNGICVWSPGFENKRSSMLSYYDVRNIMLTEALYTEDGLLKRMKQYCRKRILANALRYRYNDAKLVLDAVEDFCKGPEYLGTLNPEEKNKEIGQTGYAMKPVEELTSDPVLLKEIHEYVQPENIEEIYNNRNHENKWFYALTLNGWILPANKEVKAFPMGIWPYSLYRVGKVILFDPDSCKGIYGEKSWKELFRCIGYYFQICKLLKNEYPKARAAYKEKFKWLTSYECWVKYLKVDQ